MNGPIQVPASPYEIYLTIAVIIVWVVAMWAFCAVTVAAILDYWSGRNMYTDVRGALICAAPITILPIIFAFVVYHIFIFLKNKIYYKLYNLLVLVFGTKRTYN
jgi:hypothetical protein